MLSPVLAVCRDRVTDDSTTIATVVDRRWVRIGFQAATGRYWVRTLAQVAGFFSTPWFVPIMQRGTEFPVLNIIRSTGATAFGPPFFLFLLPIRRSGARLLRLWSILVDARRFNSRETSQKRRMTVQGRWLTIRTEPDAEPRACAGQEIRPPRLMGYGRPGHTS